jgi:hypothetical protein
MESSHVFERLRRDSGTAHGFDHRFGAPVDLSGTRSSREWTSAAEGDEIRVEWPAGGGETAFVRLDLRATIRSSAMLRWSGTRKSGALSSRTLSRLFP